MTYGPLGSLTVDQIKACVELVCPLAVKRPCNASSACQSGGQGLNFADAPGSEVQTGV